MCDVNTGCRFSFVGRRDETWRAFRLASGTHAFSMSWKSDHMTRYCFFPGIS
jgi:hypothetical protein